MEPEGLTGTSKEREVRKEKGDAKSTSDKGGKRDSGRIAKVREGKEPHRDLSCDEERRARETADEKDAAEDAADKKEYLALQSKMEARRIAREIQTAHDTLASLRAERDGVSAQSETVPKTRVENDRTRDEDEAGSKVETKKARASRIAASTSIVESEAPSATEAPRRVEGNEKTKPIKIGGGKATDVMVVPKKTVVKIRMKRPTCTTEPPRIATEKITAQSSGEELMSEALGPALVAGALGRKIGDARTATMMRGITECRVELLSTRQKAKLPVPAVPNNSAESNSAVDGIGAYDARLSLSATDQNVHLELPGDVAGVTTAAATPDKTEHETIAGKVNPEPRRISLTSVAKQRDGIRSHSESTGEITNGPQNMIFGEDVNDMPVIPGEIATPTTYSEEAGRIEGGDGTGRTTEKRRLLREIDVAATLRAHLAEMNPEVTTAM